MWELLKIVVTLLVAKGKPALLQGYRNDFNSQRIRCAALRTNSYFEKHPCAGRTFRLGPQRTLEPVNPSEKFAVTRPIEIPRQLARIYAAGF